MQYKNQMLVCIKTSFILMKIVPFLATCFLYKCEHFRTISKIFGTVPVTEKEINHDPLFEILLEFCRNERTKKYAIFMSGSAKRNLIVSTRYIFRCSLQSLAKVSVVGGTTSISRKKTVA